MRVTDSATSSALHDLSRYEIRTLRRQARHGDAAAAFTLAMAYETGYLVPQSCKKAAALVETSAKAGNLAAEYNLGLRYRYGDGIPANANKAAKWLQKAEGRGYPKPTIVVSAN
ncbi:MAG TPA: hypothetical protein VFE61_01200 [Candidatus Sulfotelmatobacter sp.]|nr:hypothetical protein [Candidatus Sulfotelmatobacter sp.]